ncbi:MAG: hypothetical protein AB1652_00750 [Bacillota bacterium]
MRYTHPDPALAAIVTDLLKSTSRVKPLAKRINAISEKAWARPEDDETIRRAIFHACLFLTKRERKNGLPAGPRRGGNPGGRSYN